VDPTYLDSDALRAIHAPDTPGIKILPSLPNRIQPARRPGPKFSRLRHLPRNRTPLRDKGILTVLGTFNHSPENLHIDTCASASTISRRVAKEYELEVEEVESERLVNMAGPGVRLLGFAKVVVGVGALKEEITVQVLDTESFTILLGTDWCQRVGLVVDFRGNVIGYLMKRSHGQSVRQGTLPFSLAHSGELRGPGGGKGKNKPNLPGRVNSNLLSEKARKVALAEVYVIEPESAIDVRLTLPRKRGGTYLWVKDLSHRL
jgi:predicted aspartyl protease